MNPRVTVLDNGLRVVTDAFDAVQSASVGVWVDAGARNETAEVNGIAHLLEHMAFKGTGRRSAAAIAQEIEAVGGHLNAYTGREQTAYYAKVLKDDLPLAVDLLGDILQDSVFDQDELRRERAVVIQEIGQSVDTPDDIVFDHLQATAYPEQSLGRPILGTTDTVRRLSRDHLFGYLAQHYGPGSMVLAASGNLDHDRLIVLAEETFGRMSAPARAGEAHAARYVGGDHRVDRPLEQLHLVVGLRGVGYHHRDQYAMSLLSTVLGGGMSSRLFQEIRERRGLVYAIYAFTSFFADDGLLGIYAGTGADEVAELVPVLCDEIRRIGSDVTDAEVKRAQAQLRSQILMGMESTSARCEHLAATTLMFGHPLPATDVVARIEAVTTDDVTRMARKLVEDPVTVSAVGPIAALEPYDRLSARLV